MNVIKDVGLGGGSDPRGVRGRQWRRSGYGNQIEQRRRGNQHEERNPTIVRASCDCGTRGHQKKRRCFDPDFQLELQRIDLWMPAQNHQLGVGKKIYVGKVTEFVLEDVSIDSIVFGVKAIGQDGAESRISPYVNPPRTRTEHIALP